MHAVSEIYSGLYMLCLNSDCL